MQQQADPQTALNFLDGILGNVAGSRKDHVAIQGALGVIAAVLAQALAPSPPESDDLEALASEQTPEA